MCKDANVMWSAYLVRSTCSEKIMYGSSSCVRIVTSCVRVSCVRIITSCVVKSTINMIGLVNGVIMGYFVVRSTPTCVEGDSVVMGSVCKHCSLEYDVTMYI